MDHETRHVKPSGPGGDLTVSQVADLLRGVLLGLPAPIRVVGEVSNFRPPGRGGHAYFTLKDAGAALSVVMFESHFRRLRWPLRDGLAVRLSGSLGWFAPQGRVQFYAQGLELFGQGELDLLFQDLCDRLRAEGLFDPARKRQLPRFPVTVGLITSADSAAVRDMVRAIRRRNPTIRMVLLPVQVQGDAAVAQVTAALRLAASLRGNLRPDVLIVGRGGGSREDLWTFNEEPVARAVASSEIVTIAAIGHESDTTVTCLVADVRAATPTAGAELASPRRDDLLEQLAALQGRLTLAAHHRLRLERETLASLERHPLLRRPQQLWQDRRQQVDWLDSRLLSAGQRLTHRPQRLLAVLTSRVQRASPQVWLHRAQQRLSDLKHRLRSAVQAGLEARHRVWARAAARLAAADLRQALVNRRNNVDSHHARLVGQLHRRQLVTQGKLDQLVGRLTALDPRRILYRGYTITRRQNGQLVRRPDDVQGGDTLITLTAHGEVISTVTPTPTMPSLSSLPTAPTQHSDTPNPARATPAPKPPRRQPRSPEATAQTPTLFE